MVVVPAPTMVTVLPTIVATDMLELIYVKVPSLFVVGGTKLNVASPIIFVGTEKLVNMGVNGVLII
jgi:hypothetical protein